MLTETASDLREEEHELELARDNIPETGFGNLMECEDGKKRNWVLLCKGLG